MKLWSQIVQLATVCAAIAAGAWSGVELCDWLDPIPEEELAYLQDVRAAGESGQENGSALAAKGKTTERNHVDGTVGTSRSRGWIAEPKHGPYRRGATRVAGVRGDGSIRSEAVDSGEARRGVGETLRKALRKRGKAPKEEREAQLTYDPYSSHEHKRQFQNPVVLVTHEHTPVPPCARESRALRLSSCITVNFQVSAAPSVS